MIILQIIKSQLKVRNLIIHNEFMHPVPLATSSVNTAGSTYQLASDIQFRIIFATLLASLFQPCIRLAHQEMASVVDNLDLRTLLEQHDDV